MLAVLEQVPASTVAPDRGSPPPSREVSQPPPILHVALIVPDARFVTAFTGRALLYKPASWQGEVKLHLISQADWEATMGVWATEIDGEMVIAE